MLIGYPFFVEITNLVHGGANVPINPKRRQRKLEKKHAERKARLKVIRRRQSQHLSATFSEISLGRLLHCEVGNSTWESGIGHLWVGRETRDGLVAYASFLVDVHCLGVKDCFGNLCSRPEYFSRFSQLRENIETEPMSLACARKLIEGAVAYAAEASLEPHPNYNYLKLIFADADVAACTREFTFGYDGKPFFSQGPHDTLDRCREIISKLTQRYGPNGFHFLMGGPAAIQSGDVLSLTSGYDLEESPDDEENL
jgi:hypothetical protein